MNPVGATGRIDLACHIVVFGRFSVLCTDRGPQVDRNGLQSLIIQLSLIHVWVDILSCTKCLDTIE